ncbi:16S ribosomal RNA methyltransferase KsgA/Dim1 family protein [Hartmannibacter diazotrophicus]|uniref:16S ribosomal RNA methyltransferase KsgA/Dim1 family protein n=1 Tax=Hartmannibacter diazotrophicus TaxID=1482074 RepID=A0A2C9DDL3_9HYPH|nr:methyltransferase domain-containing protein [Hartmannibacter diazotrophicus]SON58356.1 16S ribosomal RNA methyltransferase KsgA/Dim1 family protein [Hartmannibacter diazotrophicus]
MLQETRCPSGRFRTIVDDEVRFIRSWMEKPLTTGAVSPSGRFLARAMASRVDVSLDGPVIELGPGTGPVTRALLGHGIAPERIHAVEYNPAFANLLKTRFSAISVIVGDAYGLEKTLQDRVDGPFSAIVSSLPLFTRPAPDRRRLMEQAMRLLKPGAPFIQFSYALVPPLPASPGEWTLEVSPWILRNLPPARVWTYRSDAGA